MAADLQAVLEGLYNVLYLVPDVGIIIIEDVDRHRDNEKHVKHAAIPGVLPAHGRAERKADIGHGRVFGEAVIDLRRAVQLRQFIVYGSG